MEGPDSPNQLGMKRPIIRPRTYGADVWRPGDEIASPNRAEEHCAVSFSKASEIQSLWF